MILKIYKNVCFSSVFNLYPGIQMFKSKVHDIHTVCPNKHGNSVTILDLSTSAWLDDINSLILQPSWAEVDKLKNNQFVVHSAGSVLPSVQNNPEIL